MGKTKPNKKPIQEQKHTLVHPFIKWFILIVLAPAVALCIKLFCGYAIAPEARVVYGSLLTCTDILSAGIGLAIACFADVSASEHHNKWNFSIGVSVFGLMVLIVFCACIGAEIRNEIRTFHWVVTLIATMANALCCWRLSFITGVKRKTTSNKSQTR